MKRVLQEGVLLAVIGAALGFIANALSPHGLELAKDYFPGTKVAAPAPMTGTNPAGGIVKLTNSPLELLSARLKEKGLQLVESNRVVQLFHDPRRQVDAVIFIDARDDEHYQAGHIPGAYHFDRFHPEQYLANVVQVCLSAQEIVFYCNGGDCDDSEHAAIMLRDSIGIPKEKVFVYGGGVNEWKTTGLPLELGARNSGQYTNVVRTAVAEKTEGAKQ